MFIEKSQKDYWNGIGSEKQFNGEFQISEFIKYVSKDAKILEYGCGYGRILNELLLNGFNNVTGIDTSEKMIERSQIQYPNLNVKLIKSDEIPFEDNTFDVVTLLQVLVCAYDDIEQKYIINQIKKVLKPNGIIYISDFLLNTDEKNLLRYEKYLDKYKRYGIFELDDGLIVRHQDANWIKELTSDFKEIVFEKTTWITMNRNTSNGFYYLGKLIK